VSVAVAVRVNPTVSSAAPADSSAAVWCAARTSVVTRAEGRLDCDARNSVVRTSFCTWVAASHGGTTW
jgi:hypothetical protein